MPTVIVLGGGVAGLTVAHELVTRGLEVAVYERRHEWGGKARSFGASGTATHGHRDLPAEHGFRFFPGFYKHVTDTMRRIPVRDGGPSVFDNLVPTMEITIAQADGRPQVKVPSRFPESLAEWQAAVDDLRHRADIGVSHDEMRHFTGKLLDIFTACDARRFATYEYQAWWDYIGAASRSKQYQLMLGIGLTRSLVAMKAEQSNSRTIGTMLEQMTKYVLQPGEATDRVLNGPTTDTWIDPWVSLLKTHGVTFHAGARVTGIHVDGSRVTGVAISHRDGTTEDVTGDYYVSAVPVEVFRKFVTPALRRAAPAVATLDKLRVEWMNGIVFYLKRDIPIAHGHIILMNSPWALTCISQPQFWGADALSRFGDGSVRGLLSVDVSAWTEPGQSTPLPAADCAPLEIARECWGQIKAHLPDITDDDLIAPLDDPETTSWYLDRDISFGHQELAMPAPVAAPGSGSHLVAAAATPIVKTRDKNAEPLLVNTLGSYQLRPDTNIGLANFFLAGDYVKTFTDLACMEGANESGRRAANAILAVAGSPAERCRLWPLTGMLPFAPFRAIDWCLFQLGLPQIPIGRYGAAVRALVAFAVAVLKSRVALRRAGAGGPPRGHKA